MELNAAEQTRADLLCEQLDLTAPGAVLRYGAACQKQIASCSGMALSQLRAKDAGSSGALLAGLAEELRTFSLEPDKKRGLFRRRKRKDDFSSRCSAAREKAAQTAGILEEQRNLLTRDAVLLGKLCDSIHSCCRELAIQIQAGRQRLNRSDPIPDALRDRFQRRLYDLEVSHTVGLQTLAQLQLLRNSDLELTEKITSMLNVTLPLWEGQLVLALGLARAGEARHAPGPENAEETRRAGRQLSAALDEFIQLRQADMEQRRSMGETMERTEEQML